MEEATIITSAKRWKVYCKALAGQGRPLPPLTAAEVLGSHKKGSLALSGPRHEVFAVWRFLGGRLA